MKTLSCWAKRQLRRFSNSNLASFFWKTLERKHVSNINDHEVIFTPLKKTWSTNDWYDVIATNMLLYGQCAIHWEWNPTVQRYIAFLKVVILVFDWHSEEIIIKRVSCCAIELDFIKVRDIYTYKANTCIYIYILYLSIL